MYLHSRNAITSQLTPSHNHSQSQSHNQSHSQSQSRSRGNHKRSQCREMRCKSPGNQVQVALALCTRRRVAVSLPTCNCRRFVLPTRSLVTDPAPINCNQYTRSIPAAGGCLLYAATQRQAQSNLDLDMPHAISRALLEEGTFQNIYHVLIIILIFVSFVS